MVKQLRVSLDDRPGMLARLLSALAAEKVDVKALEVHALGEGGRGQANLLVSDLARASHALDAEGFAWELDDALAIAVPDRPGGLAEILRLLAEQGQNVRYLYASVSRVAGQSLSVLTVDDPARAAKALRAAGITLVADLDLEQPGEGTASGSGQAGGATLADHLGIDFVW